MKRKRRWKRAILAAFVFFAVQVVYFALVYGSFPCDPPLADMTVVYSGRGDRMAFVPEWNQTRITPLFLFSGHDYSVEELENSLHLGRKMLVEDQAWTTDQNARFCAPIIRKAGVKNVVLALPWYHLPRALFLTRLYLMGSGVNVTPYATLPIPPNWWTHKEFYAELVKFWGSLVRIVLSWVGIENWPPPSGG